MHEHVGDKANFAECIVNMLQAHQQPESGTRGQMHPANAATLTTRGPGLPRVPLSQASLNTPPAFASSSGSPAPSTASTNTGERMLTRHSCMHIVCNLSIVTLVAFTSELAPVFTCGTLTCLQWTFQLLNQTLCSGCMGA